MTEKNSTIMDKNRLLHRAKELALELKPQMREFCEAIASNRFDTNTAAAVHAGYAENTARIKASGLLSREDVQEYIQILRSIREITSAIDDQTIVRMQLTVYDDAMAKGDLKAANTAVDQLAKMHQLYKNTTAGSNHGGKIADQKKTQDAFDKSKENMAEIMDLARDIRSREEFHLRTEK